MSRLVRSAHSRNTMKVLAKGMVRLRRSPLNDETQIEIEGEKHTFWLELTAEETGYLVDQLDMIVYESNPA